MSTCNYCKFEAIKRRAVRENKRVLSRASINGGTDIYVAPKSIKVPDNIKQDSVYHKKYWVVWYMSLPERCVC